MRKFAAIFGIMTIIISLALPASAVNSCVDLFSGKVYQKFDGVREYKFKESLYKRGVDTKLLRFNIVPEILNDNTKTIIIQAIYNESIIAYLTMVYSKGNRFESHIHTELVARQRGLGLFMYVIGAKISREKYKATFTSSDTPSPAAINLWNHIVNNGWGKRVSLMKSLKYRKRFQFSDRIVDQNFNDVYSYFLSRSNKLPESAWLRK